MIGKKALVTGAGSGIGEAVARKLAAEGAHLVLADVNLENVSRVASEIGGEVWQVDLSKPQELADLKLDIDILVNNAGVQTVSPIHEFDPERFSFMLNLMTVAPFMLIRASLPSMYSKGWGRIINMSSIHGLGASPFKSAYVTAKHGLEGLSKVTALEGAPHGVTSNCINPAYVRTPLVEMQIKDQAKNHNISEDEVVEKILLAKAAVKRLIEPAEVAELAAYLCSDAAQSVTGSSFRMDGGWWT